MVVLGCWGDDECGEREEEEDEQQQQSKWKMGNEVDCFDLQRDSGECI